MTRDKCAKCGEPRSDHHVFVSKEQYRPEGCECDLDEWADIEMIHKICGKFKPLNQHEPDVCGHCEHNKECHRKRKE